MAARRHKPLAERFWSKVEKTDGCWLWTAGKNRGYGRFWTDRRRHMYAHRFSWQMARGAVPDGLHVLHNCPGGDNPACVNPAHLWLGTHQDNMDDKVAKGRQPIGDVLAHNRGEGCTTAKLTEKRVQEIREAWARREVPQRELARRFGVAQGLISMIVNGKRWGHSAPKERSDG